MIDWLPLEDPVACEAFKPVCSSWRFSWNIRNRRRYESFYDTQTVCCTDWLTDQNNRGICLRRRCLLNDILGASFDRIFFWLARILGQQPTANSQPETDCGIWQTKIREKQLTNLRCFLIESFHCCNVFSDKKRNSFVMFIPVPVGQSGMWCMYAGMYMYVCMYVCMPVCMYNCWG